MTPDVSVSELNEMLRLGGAFQGHVQRFRTRTGSYSDFVSQLYVDLDRCINLLRTIVEQVQEDGEDRLTADLILQLNQMGYVASHDKKSGGHIDIGVEHGDHTWIAEAKLDWNIDEGLKQLVTRYVALSGDPTHDHGALLFYLKRQVDTKSLMDSWKTKLESDSVPCRRCDKNPLAFFSEIKMQGTGLPFHVRSIGVSLYFQPQDISGLRTRARRSGKAKPTSN